MKSSNPKQTIAELLGEVKAEEDNAKRVLVKTSVCFTGNITNRLSSG